ncbi:MAG: DNA-3-methyladenine glycosylase 2 family protein [Tissierellia bacterium]|nr:DNA-3-methyladenine glycosylase 2 family protein [Tissierellia bacterium]
MYFEYGNREKEYLSKKDPKLGLLIDHIGHIKREVNPDIYSSIVHQIVSQQISSGARDTIWARFEERLGEVELDSVLSLSEEEIQTLGISNRKAKYILDFSTKVREGVVNLGKLQYMEDKEVIESLCQVKGIGPWTAQMTLIFSMQRPDVISYGDFAIRKGMMLVYGLKELSEKEFIRITSAYSPHSTVASLYLWEASRGNLPEVLKSSDY